MQKRHVKAAVLILLAALPCSLPAEDPKIEEPTPAVITPRFLQYDDEYHTYELALLGAQSSLSNMNLTLTNMIENCDNTKRLHRKGITNSNDVKACEHQVEQKQSEIDLHKLFVASLERGREIAHLNRSSESGKPTSMSDLASQYVSKWKDEATQAAIKTKMAQRRLTMETASWEHNQRMMKKGYIQWSEYEAARVGFQKVHNDLENAVQREEKLKALLARAERNLESIRKTEVAPPKQAPAVEN